MSELDRWGDSAAVALLDEITGAETEEALAIVRAGGRGNSVDRPRWALLALAAAALVVLVGGVALIKSRDTDEVEPPLARYANGHLAACHHPMNVDSAEIGAAERDAASPLSAGKEMPAAA